MVFRKINPKIKEYLKYDKDTGKLTWIQRPSRRIKIGDEAGSLSHYGYVEIGFNGTLIKAHRIAWFLHYNEDPKDQIDHINGIREDNKIDNLRVVSNRKNSQNNKRNRNGKLVGAYRRKGKSRWESSVYIDGKYNYLGVYSTEQEAHDAYINKLQGVTNELHV